jgi:MFS family permease
MAVSDLRLIGVIGAAHFISHFFQLALPPLFPLLRDEFGVGYLALGLVMSLFYGVSGVGQAAAGFLVDRFGARRLLLAGSALMAVAFGLAGFAGSFSTLIVLVLAGALGNSVFHPADYAILNAAVDPRRLGRAFSAHGIGGSLGYAAGPAVTVALASVLGWRGALIAAGSAGLVWVLILVRETRDVPDTASDRRADRHAAPRVRHDVALLLTAPILAAFAYFTILAMAGIGTQTFAVAGMTALYAAPLATATAALTGFLVGKAAGVAAGGVIADRTTRHDIVAAAGMLGGAAFMLVVASGTAPFPIVAVAMTLAGLAIGVVQPSRDMLVRAATPPGASGKVFGFVYSGLDLGSALTPLLFGWLLDRGQPRAMFVAIAVLMLVTIATVVEVRRRAVPAAAVH